MEQRKGLSLADRKKWQSSLPIKKENPPTPQEKRTREQKGSRGQLAGASKPPAKGVGKQAPKKKPGRAKPTSGKKKAAPPKRPRRTE